MEYGKKKRKKHSDCKPHQTLCHSFLGEIKLIMRHQRAECYVNMKI